MLSLKTYNPYPSPFEGYPQLQELWYSAFPQDRNYNPMEKLTTLEKVAHVTGRGFGHTKKFFSKTETKVATLVAYWAADAFLALVLVLSSTNPIAISIALAMLILHTYATFSVVGEII